MVHFRPTNKTSNTEMLRRRNSRRLITTITGLFMFIVLYNLIFYGGSTSNVIIESGSNDAVYSLVYEYKHGIYLYNMNEPIETWWMFECIDTKMRHTVNTKLCIHDAKYDQHVSGQLKQHGLWEPNNVRSFIKQMSEVPDAQFIDIGANIGLYTLMAAKHNRSVIAVEPLHENVIRIHKAAYLENVQSKITALVNAISNERKQLNIMLVDDNLGGSFVLNEVETPIIDAENIALTRSSVIVNSIVLDDLIEIIKTKIPNGEKKEKMKFILKIDIESYEPYAFENSTNLFKEFDIVAIYLEFGKILEKLKLFDSHNLKDKQQGLEPDEKKVELYDNYLSKVLKMVELFRSSNYDAYEINGYNKLEFQQWRHWPWDIYLRQCDLLICAGRPFKVQGI